jgi:hypothetical protein
MATNFTGEVHAVEVGNELRMDDNDSHGGFYLNPTDPI